MTDKNTVSYSLTESDIRHQCPGIKIISHDEMLTYKSINAIFKDAGEWNTVILHYSPDGEFYGHWCALKRLDGKIIYFDPYGTKVDTPQKVFDNEKKYHLAHLLTQGAKTKEQLNKLLARRKINEPFYNDKQFQEFHPQVNTCGRHCVLFARMSNLDADKTYQFLTDMATKHGYDNLDEFIVEYIRF